MKKTIFLIILILSSLKISAQTKPIVTLRWLLLEVSTGLNPETIIGFRIDSLEGFKIVKIARIVGMQRKKEDLNETNTITFTSKSTINHISYQVEVSQEGMLYFISNESSGNIVNPPDHLGITGIQLPFGAVVEWAPVTRLNLPKLERDLKLKPNPMQGDDVIFIQTLLLMKGYIVLGDSMGIFNKGTKSAVKQFQEANKLTINGIVDIKTWKYLIAEDSKDFEN